MKKLFIGIGLLVLSAILSILLVNTVLRSTFLIPIPVDGELKIICTGKQDQMAASNQVRIQKITVNGEEIDFSNIQATSPWHQEDGLLVCYDAKQPEAATLTLKDVESIQVELVGQSGSGFADLSFLKKSNQMNLY